MHAGDAGHDSLGGVVRTGDPGQQLSHRQADADEHAIGLRIPGLHPNGP
ncbi:hypothetical protein M2157_008653 [Streptomyces sp. SAI-127]|nr:hypothetical protein [Streptomyces sp. SAI-127]